MRKVLLMGKRDIGELLLSGRPWRVAKARVLLARQADTYVGRVVAKEVPSRHAREADIECRHAWAQATTALLEWLLQK